MNPNSLKFPNWWLLLATGALFLGIGGLAFINPLSSYLKLVKFTGVGLLLNGALLLTICVVNTQYASERKWMQAESVLHLFFGILFIFNPLLAFIALPYFIGAWILLVGLLKTAAALSLKKIIRGWTFILGVGILSILFGLLMLYSPFAKARHITLLIGIFGVIMGSCYLIDAWRYRHAEDAMDMML